MAFKDILVQLDNHRNYESRLQIALSLAVRNEGRVTALYGFELPEEPKVALSLADAVYPASDAARASYEQQRDGAFDDATQFEAAFYSAAKRAGVPASWEIWPEKPKGFIDTISARARYADIAVLGQADPEHPMFDALARLPETVMLASGRPVLIVPSAAQASSVGKRVLVAWSGTREGARAVADAMPLLHGAEAVTVLSIVNEDLEGRGVEPARDLVRHLAQHGVRASATSRAALDFEMGDKVLSCADELGCDLIVMGGYGHSPTRELILGGVTRAVLHGMTVPVLMSH